MHAVHAAPRTVEGSKPADRNGLVDQEKVGMNGETSRRQRSHHQTPHQAQAGTPTAIQEEARRMMGSSSVDASASATSLSRLLHIRA